MDKKALKLLENQLEKLNEKNFDLDSWKQYTLLILSRMFGKDDEKVNQLSKLDYEFNSWSLRDAAGNESYEEGTKKLARQIMQAAIDEVKVFGLASNEPQAHTVNYDEFRQLILDQFKGADVRKIENILHAQDSREEKTRRLREIIKGLDAKSTEDILIQILMVKHSK